MSSKEEHVYRELIFEDEDAFPEERFSCSRCLVYYEKRYYGQRRNGDRYKTCKRCLKRKKEYLLKKSRE